MTSTATTRAGLDQYGYVTTGNAAELHVPAVELRKIAQRGGLDHVAYGLYRFDDIPRAALDQYMEAVLRVGPSAYLTHDTVLAVHDLAMVNPNHITPYGEISAEERELAYDLVVNRRDDALERFIAHFETKGAEEETEGAARTGIRHRQRRTDGRRPVGREVVPRCTLALNANQARRQPGSGPGCSSQGTARHGRRAGSPQRMG